MKESVLRSLCFVGLLVGLSAFAQGPDTVWTGKISDSMCGASHANMMAQHKDAKMTDRDCTLACIKAGAKYVFVSAGKVYNIENQNHADMIALLQEHAGETVKLTGEMKGDNITVANVVKNKQ
jgi:hypothetical protein